MELNSEQEKLVNDLISGVLTKKQFSAMRSSMRRYNKLDRSIDLAIIFEVYKYRLKNKGEEYE